MSLGALAGYVTMLPVIAARLDHWRKQQEAYAQADLLVIADLAKSVTAEPGSDLASRIAKGELRWESGVKRDGNQSANPSGIARQAPREMDIDWTREPGGFERMRMTYELEAESSDDSQVRTVSLIRRFALRDIANSVGNYGFAMLLIGLAGGLVATAAIYFRATRKQELKWLRSIGNVLPSRDYRERRPRIRFVSVPFAESVYTIADAMNLQVEQVRASFENSSRAMTNMPIGILSFDNQLHLEFINPAGRKLLSLSNAQEGKSLIEVVRAPIVLECIQETHRTGKSTEVEYERNAEKLWLRLRTHPLISGAQEQAARTESEEGDSHPPSGHPVLLTVIDESRLKQLENLRRDFTANVSHELKTPLAAIKAYAETLLMGAAEDPENCHRFIERIGEQANRLDTLIRDLLQLTRLQSQPETPKLHSIRIGDVLRALVENHRAVGDKKKLRWELNIDEQICVHSDLESLQMIFNNLLSNAVRYNKEEGVVSIVVEQDSEHCIVRIRDNGIGIPAGDLERIFERFYRVEKARSQDAGGTGLGLAIVKHLAASIFATVSVRSQLGQGSEFQVRIPLANRQ